MQIDVNQEIYKDLGFNRPQAEKANDELGQAEFLKLMTTQMQYQDPMKPMENGEFLTQIAQFGVNTGMQQLNDSFAEFTKTNNSVKVVEAANMVGRSVLVPGSNGRLLDDGVMSGSIDVPGAVPDLQFSVVNENGVPVYSEVVGNAGDGLMNFNWFGQTNQDGVVAPPGRYQIRAEATVNGERQALQTYMVVPVNSVAVGTDSNLTLDLGEFGETSLDKVKRVL